VHPAAVACVVFVRLSEGTALNRQRLSASLRLLNCVSHCPRKAPQVSIIPCRTAIGSHTVPAVNTLSNGSDTTGRPASGGSSLVSLVWFSARDLRLHDHEPLTQACLSTHSTQRALSLTRPRGLCVLVHWEQALACSTSVVPVFVFDSREFQQQGSPPSGSSSGSSRCGDHRCAAVLQCPVWLFWRLTHTFNTGRISCTTA
jgi:DNA photolyase